MSKEQKMSSIVEGPKGESIFSSPLHGMMDRTINELSALFKKTNGLEDDRLLSLVTALIVEERIDKLLITYLPRYSDLLVSEDCSFTVKIRTLQALNLIPLHITEACHVLRLIRNDFAHQLTLTTFDDLPQKTLRKLVSFQAKLPENWKFEQIGREPLRNFTAVSWVAILGIDSYLPSVQKLRAKQQEASFIQALQKEHSNECDAKFKAAKAAGPSARYQMPDGRWAYQYSYFRETSDLSPEKFFAIPGNAIQGDGMLGVPSGNGL